MKKCMVFRSLAGLMLFGLGVASGLVAQPHTDSPQRLEQQRTDLAGAPGIEVIASTGDYKPGEGIEFHHHHGLEVAYVIQGATVQVPGNEPVILPSGVSVFNLRDVKHGGFEVVGDTTLKLFTVHIVDKDKPLYNYID